MSSEATTLPTSGFVAKGTLQESTGKNVKAARLLVAGSNLVRNPKFTKCGLERVGLAQASIPVCRYRIQTRKKF